MHNSTNIPNTTAASTSSTVEPDITIRTVRLCLYTAAFVTGLIGNLLVVLIIIKKAKRSIHQMFILNLAFSDLTFLAFCIPLAMYRLYEAIYVGELFCRMIYPMQTITYFTGIFTITSMAVHRCYVIVNPYKPKMIDRTAYVWIALIWILPLIIVTPLSVVNKAIRGVCVEGWPSFDYRKAYTFALFLLQFMLPLCVIAVAYIWTGIYLIRNKGPETTMGNKKQSINQAKKRRENKQIITTLAAIVALFTICMLPGQIAWMIMDFGTLDQQDIAITILKFSDILDFIHACVNPVAYGLLTDAFRRDYKRAFAAVSRFISCGRTTIAPGSDESTIIHIAPNTPTICLRATVAQTEPISIESQSSSQHTLRSFSGASNIVQSSSKYYDTSSPTLAFGILQSARPQSSSSL